MQIALLKITHQLPDPLFAQLLAKVDKDKQDRIQRFFFYQDKQRCLFADLLVRMLLVKTTGLRNEELNFFTLPFGKPLLQNNPSLHFNTSHAGNWIACVIDTKPVGIDVEQVDDIDLSLADSFFCKEEHENIITSKQPAEKFFDYWTLKESYIKYIGKGLSQPLNSFCIKFLEDGISVEAEGALMPGVYFKQYEVESGYKLAVCGKHKDFLECEVFRYEEVIKFMLDSGGG